MLLGCKMKIKPTSLQKIWVLESLREEYPGTTTLANLLDEQIDKYNKEQNGEK